MSAPFAHVHLQWFAAPDEGRTEPPSALRLRTARETGQVARSAELAAACVLLGGVIAVALLGASLMATTRSMLHHFLSGAAAQGPALAGVAPTALIYAARLVLPVVAVGFVCALCGNLMQVGFRMTARPIVPDTGRLVPRWGRFFSRMFSAEAGFNLAKELVKVATVGVIAGLNIDAALERLAAVPVAEGSAVMVGAAWRICSQTALALLLLAILDYLYRRHQQHVRLQMSPREVREEHRRQEGDRAVRERLRHRMRDLLARSVQRQVPGADLVIADPNQYAVALRWDRTTMQAPLVVAKGTAAAARQIGALAVANGVAVVENPSLAGTLCAAVAIGDPIPQQFYPPAAAIMARLPRSPGGGR